MLYSTIQRQTTFSTLTLLTSLIDQPQHLFHQQKLIIMQGAQL